MVRVRLIALHKATPKIESNSRHSSPALLIAVSIYSRTANPPSKKRVIPVTKSEACEASKRRFLRIPRGTETAGRGSFDDIVVEGYPIFIGATMSVFMNPGANSTPPSGTSLTRSNSMGAPLSIPTLAATHQLVALPAYHYFFSLFPAAKPRQKTAEPSAE